MRQVVALLLFVVGCGGTVQPGASNELVALAIQPFALAMRAGQVAQLRAIGLTASGDTLPDPSVRWSSHDPAVASVDSTGRLVAIQCCRTMIEARVGEIKAILDLIVVEPLCISVFVSPASVTLRVGEQIRANAQASGDAGCSAVNWSSRAPAVAAVSDSGVVTALSVGQAAIVARSKRDTTLFGASAVTVVP